MSVRWIMLGLLLFCMPRSAFAQEGRTIRGTVVQGTAGGGSTAGLEVVLGFLDDEQAPPLRTTTDAEGQFAFTGLPVDKDLTYLLQVAYAGVVYSPGPLSLPASVDTNVGLEDEAQVELTVYETTEDPGTLFAQRAHILVTPAEDQILVTELYVFANPDDRTYIGRQEVQGQRWTSRLSVPAASRDLALEDGVLGGRFMVLEGGFVDTEPYWPGTTSVLFSYRLDCPRGVCDLSRPVWQPIADLNVLLPDTGATLTGSAALNGRRDAEGMTFLNYTVQGLQAGERLNLRLALPGAADASPMDPNVGLAAAPALPWMILITVLAVLPLAYPFWRQHIQSSARQDE